MLPEKFKKYGCYVHETEYDLIYFFCKEISFNKLSNGVTEIEVKCFASYDATQDYLELDSFLCTYIGASREALKEEKEILLKHYENSLKEFNKCLTLNK